jgi:hypothetical protein
MKVVSNTISDTETSSTIDFAEELSGLSKSDKADTLREIGDFILENTLLNVGSSKSPIKGGAAFKPLSPLYAKLKQSEVGNKLANLELTGEMLDSLDYKILDDKITIGIFGKSAPKADGHNNLSGKSKLPQRSFLPKKGEEYKSDIAKEISRIIADSRSSLVGDIKSILGIKTKAALYDILGELLGLTSRNEIRLAALRNAELLSLLEDNDLESLL